MSVSVFFGRWPDDTASQELVVELYQMLESQPEHYMVLLNFHAGGSNEIDLVVMKPGGIFVIEHKHYRNKVSGGQEGVWKSVNSTGDEIIVKPGKPNPYKQVKFNYWHFKDWLEKNAEAISAGVPRTTPLDFSASRSYIVFSPDLHPDSEVDIGEGPVMVMGKPTFLLTLKAHIARNLDLTPLEMNRIPKLLQLEEWHILEPTTIRLKEWKPEPFTVLVARGYEMAVPIFKLDAIKKDAITIGRENDNDLVIPDETVSRHHAVIRREENNGKEVYIVEDLGSTSGSYVAFSGDPGAEKPLQAGVPNALKNNSLVRFGGVAFTFLEHRVK